jgi:hypothetical protein
LLGSKKLGFKKMEQSQHSQKDINSIITKEFKKCFLVIPELENYIFGEHSGRHSLKADELIRVLKKTIGLINSRKELGLDSVRYDLSAGSKAKPR